MGHCVCIPHDAPHTVLALDDVIKGLVKEVTGCAKPAKGETEGRKGGAKRGAKREEGVGAGQVMSPHTPRRCFSRV